MFSIGSQIGWREAGQWAKCSGGPGNIWPHSCGRAPASRGSSGTCRQMSHHYEVTEEGSLATAVPLWLPTNQDFRGTCGQRQGNRKSGLPWATGQATLDGKTRQLGFPEDVSIFRPGTVTLKPITSENSDFPTVSSHIHAGCGTMERLAIIPGLRT